MNYRTAPSEPRLKSVVQYRPSDWSGLSLTFAALAFAVGMMIFLGAQFARSVELHCARATDACLIETHWPLFTQTQRIPLRTIASTVIMGNKKSGFDVALVTVDEPSRVATNITIPHGADAPIDLRNAQQQQIDAFLGDRGAASIDLLYSHGAPLPTAACWLLSILPLWGFVYLWNGGRFEVDWNERRARIVRARWPFPPQRTSARLDEIARVEVLEVPNKKNPGSSWNVAITLTHGAKEKLATAAGTSKENAQRAVTEIREILRRRDEELGG